MGRFKTFSLHLLMLNIAETKAQMIDCYLFFLLYENATKFVKDTKGEVNPYATKSCNVLYLFSRYAQFQFTSSTQPLIWIAQKS